MLTSTVRNITARNLSRGAVQLYAPVLAVGCKDKCFSTAVDPDLLHKSIVPTDHFQRSLPRLPVPKLEDTCRRYINAQKPLLTEEQLNHVQKLTGEFQNGEGKVLHEELVEKDKANKHTSYISGPWFDMYLKDRRPVVFNHTPFMMYHDDPNQEYNNQLIRATNMVVSSMKFMKTIRANVLEPEVFHLNPKKSDTLRFRKFVRMLPQAVAFYGAYIYKAFPLDISQYPGLFNSTRIPRPVRDELYRDASAKHLMVVRNGHIYTFDVLDKDGYILPSTEIMAHLQHILSDTRPPPESPIGIFTTENRDTWTSVREKLIQAGNSEQLEQIDTAVFALILEDQVVEKEIDISRLFLHGNGYNRWWDKSFSVIMTKNGKASINFEHSWGDGVGVVRYQNEVFKDSTTNPQVHPDTTPANVDSSSAVRKIDFNLTDEIKQFAKEAQKKFDDTVATLDIQLFYTELFGKNFLKTVKLSPDSVMQLIIQMAFFKQHGHFAATYESCSTAAFKHGRTETLRSCTTATANACKMFAQRTGTLPSLSDMAVALEECSKMHGELTKEAAMGQGFDRHLFGLKTLAEAKGELPEFFKDLTYQQLNKIIISTSTLSSPAIVRGGFGPVNPDSFGVGYAIQDNILGSITTAYPSKNAAEFLQCFEQSAKEIYSVLQGQDFRS